MPELPEVETTCRGIRPWLEGQTIISIDIREPRLRWPVSDQVLAACGQRVERVRRRAKYIIIEGSWGALLLHLGMSGSIRASRENEALRKHEHFDINTDRVTLRYCDPRRFGSLHWSEGPAERHALLASLGPEPLGNDFDGQYLHRLAHNRRLPVKSFIMDGRVVVGVGNIYASEALFMAGIHPNRAAGRISLARYTVLAEAIRDVLRRAIQQGGTTLRDFSGTGGTPGYFAQDLLVYERDGLTCMQCSGTIRRKVIGQRSSYYCSSCQR